MELSLLVSVLCTLAFVPSSLSVSYIPNEGGCCYGDRQVVEGEVVLSLPGCCIQLVCEQGKLVEQHIGPRGAINCCEFGGVLYPPGSQMVQCFPLVCKDGNWSYLGYIDDCCGHCALYDDPHITTYDGHNYDWHDKCNYTVTTTPPITLPDQGPVYNGPYVNSIPQPMMEPEAAVYSTFEQCWGCASCVAYTDFRNDPHTIVSLNHENVFEVLVNNYVNLIPPAGSGPIRLVSNGGATTHSVLAWRMAECLIVVGSSRIALKHCSHRLDVWAHPSHSDNLDGLCGHFNYYKYDDFTASNGVVHHLEKWPVDFPSSWKTDQQTNPACSSNLTITCGTGNPCRADRAHMAGLRNMCTDRLQRIIGDRLELIHHIDDCMFDLCMMTQNGDGNRINEWLVVLQDNVVGEAREIIRMTQGREGSEEEGSEEEAPGLTFVPPRTTTPRPTPGTPKTPPYYNTKPYYPQYTYVDVTTDPYYTAYTTPVSTYQTTTSNYFPYNYGSAVNYGTSQVTYDTTTTTSNLYRYTYGNPVTYEASYTTPSYYPYNPYN